MAARCRHAEWQAHADAHDPSSHKATLAAASADSANPGAAARNQSSLSGIISAQPRPTLRQLGLILDHSSGAMKRQSSRSSSQSNTTSMPFPLRRAASPARPKSERPAARSRTAAPRPEPAEVLRRNADGPRRSPRRAIPSGRSARDANRCPNCRLAASPHLSLPESEP